MGENKDRRQLTAAELRRKENFERISEEMVDKGYTRTDLTVSIMQANVVGILMTLPIIAVIVAGFILVNRSREASPVLPWPDSLNMVLFLVSFVIFVFAHEGIHGLCWSFGAKNGLKDIEFGFVAKMLTPYCTCKVPLRRPVYITGTLMPMTLLGIIPSVISIFIGHPYILLAFLVQIVAGAGDLLIVISLLRHKTAGKDIIVLDHPYECGLVLFEK